MQKAGFGEVDAYALGRQNIAAQYIPARPIVDLCKETVQRPGTWVTKMWWEKEVMYLMVEREAAVAKEGGKEKTDGEVEGVAWNQSMVLSSV